MKVCCDTEGRELTDERRYAPTSVPLRRKPCSRSPETLFHFTGIPNFREKLICLAVSYCMTAPEEELIDTVLHEVAHALVGPEHNHDRVWKLAAMRIGCTADRVTAAARP